jgi:hypothetical protein
MIKNLKKCILNIIPQEHSWKIILLENWGDIIGELKNSITIEQIKEDVLFLGVVHPAWAQELLALSPLIKQKINSYFDKERIKTIRIKLKKNKPMEATTLNRKPWASSEKAAPSLTVSEINTLNTIKSTDLRQVMQEFYLKCKTHKQKPSI